MGYTLNYRFFFLQRHSSRFLIFVFIGLVNSHRRLQNFYLYPAVLIADKTERNLLYQRSHATISFYTNIDLTSAKKIVFSPPRINISGHSGKGGKRVFMVILREMLITCINNNVVKYRAHDF